jgi:hypothetical protein
MEEKKGSENDREKSKGPKSSLGVVKFHTDHICDNLTG